jgi:hypothetical protein
VDGDEEVTGIMSDWQAIENVVEMKSHRRSCRSGLQQGPFHDFAQIAIRRARGA